MPKTRLRALTPPLSIVSPSFQKNARLNGIIWQAHTSGKSKVADV